MVVAGTLVARVKATVWNVIHQTPSGWASATVAEQCRTAPAAAGPLEYRYVSLTTWILSEKCVVRRFRPCANVIQRIYTNLDSTV